MNTFVSVIIFLPTRYSQEITTTTTTITTRRPPLGRPSPPFAHRPRRAAACRYTRVGGRPRRPSPSEQLCARDNRPNGVHGDQSRHVRRAVHTAAVRGVARFVFFSLSRRPSVFFFFFFRFSTSARVPCLSPSVHSSDMGRSLALWTKTLSFPSRNSPNKSSKHSITTSINTSSCTIFAPATPTKDKITPASTPDVSVCRIMPALRLARTLNLLRLTTFYPRTSHTRRRRSYGLVQRKTLFGKHFIRFHKKFADFAFSPLIFVSLAESKLFVRLERRKKKLFFSQKTTCVSRFYQYQFPTVKRNISKNHFFFRRF